MTTNTVANTIANQLGGTNRLYAMVAAHSFLCDHESLTFKIGARALKGIKCVKVTLDPSDTYTVEFWSIRGINVKKVSEVHGVYCDNLKSVIEATTGLYLSL